MPSEGEFTPDNSGPIHTVTFQPSATSDAGILSWRVLVRNSAGETVHKWEGQGVPNRPLIWNGFDTDGKPLPPGIYKTALEVTDAYGNDATSVPVATTIKGGAVIPPPPPPVEQPVKAPETNGLSVKSTAEGFARHVKTRWSFLIQARRTSSLPPRQSSTKSLNFCKPIQTTRCAFRGTRIPLEPTLTIKHFPSSARRPSRMT